MNETQFKTQYIAQFLASYAAVNYADACSNGDFTSLFPVEDAEQLAEDAWQQYVELGSYAAILD
jgi:hypothetical protein